jgi:putative transposase
MARREKSKLREMIEEYGIKDMNDVHEFVKMLTAETIQTALDAELENELGYSKYDYKNKNTENSRNGYSTKTVQSNRGEMEIQIPRDRNGEFEPQLVKKHQTDVSAIEDKVIFLYSQGVSTRDIQKTMQEMYGIGAVTFTARRTLHLRRMPSGRVQRDKTAATVRALASLALF